MPGQKLEVVAQPDHKKRTYFSLIARLDSYQEIDYYLMGGIVQTALGDLWLGHREK